MSRAGQHPPLTAELAERWANFGKGDANLFINMLGLRIEEVRVDYCRILMPFSDNLNQAGGVVHGGAIATLLDTVVVPVVGSAYGRDARMSTVDMHVQFLSALIGEDAVAEGWIVKRGRTTVFCESEAIGVTSGKLIARSVMTYNVNTNVAPA